MSKLPLGLFQTRTLKKKITKIFRKIEEKREKNKISIENLEFNFKQSNVKVTTIQIYTCESTSWKHTI